MVALREQTETNGLRFENQFQRRQFQNWMFFFRDAPLSHRDKEARAYKYMKQGTPAPSDSEMRSYWYRNHN